LLAGWLAGRFDADTVSNVVTRCDLLKGRRRGQKVGEFMRGREGGERREAGGGAGRIEESCWKAPPLRSISPTRTKAKMREREREREREGEIERGLGGRRKGKWKGTL
jgi:hypothetical protein